MKQLFWYGVDFSSAKIKEGAEVYFMDNFYLTNEDNKETYEQFCEDNEMDPESDESKKCFVSEYDSDTECWCDFEGLITDCLNLEVGRGYDVFRNEDCIIGVEPYIPENDEEKKSMITKEEICHLLSKYLNDNIVEEPLSVEWHEVYAND